MTGTTLYGISYVLQVEDKKYRDIYYLNEESLNPRTLLNHRWELTAWLSADMWITAVGKCITFSDPMSRMRVLPIDHPSSLHARCFFS
jgi:zona occludens toxin (predicted ATPase)